MEVRPPYSWMLRLKSESEEMRVKESRQSNILLGAIIGEQVMVGSPRVVTLFLLVNRHFRCYDSNGG